MIAFISPNDVWFGIPPMLHLSSDSDIRSRSRRVSRTATLDGGSVFSDGGFCESDRTLVLNFLSLTYRESETLEEILSYSRVNLSISFGMFLCRPVSYDFSNAEQATISVFVEKRII